MPIKGHAAAQRAIEHYATIYKENYGRLPVVNKVSAKWNMADVIADLGGEKQAKELLNFYLKTVSTSGHSIQWFFYNYEKLVRSREAYIKDKYHREKLREESKIRTQKWKEAHGNN